MQFDLREIATENRNGAPVLDLYVYIALPVVALDNCCLSSCHKCSDGLEGAAPRPSDGTGVVQRHIRISNDVDAFAPRQRSANEHDAKCEQAERCGATWCDAHMRPND